MGILFGITTFIMTVYIWEQIRENTKDFLWLEVSFAFIMLIFVFYMVDILVSKSKRIWFSRTILFMFFFLLMGIIIISKIPFGNFYTNLGILISLVIFSIPVAMVNLNKLYIIKKD